MTKRWRADIWGKARSWLRPAPRYQGYIDERSVQHVAGWVRDLVDPAARLAFEVVLPEAGGERILYRGVADRFSPVLLAVGAGDGAHAFHVRFPRPLSADERDTLFVRPAGAVWRLELAPELRTAPDSIFPVPPALAGGADACSPALRARSVGGPWQGYLDERSVRHVAGWIRDLADPARRVEYEVVLPGPDGEHILHRGVADTFSNQLVDVGVGDGGHSFHVFYREALSPEQRDRVLVRPVGATWQAELAPEIVTAFEPIGHVALDVVDNCNLRCPFCLANYEGVQRTHVMSEETFRSVARLVPYVRPGNFWLSCLHEPTLHPRLLDLIGMVPDESRHKLFFTTNLAKRMPREFFAALAESGMHHINVSLESLDPVLYERFRKGARHSIFQANCELMLECFAAGRRRPRLRYIIMAYRSNLKEIPGLVETLLADRMAWQVEIRYTFIATHIPRAFGDAEFLTTEEWAWLAERLAHHDRTRVLLLMPPGGIGYRPANGPEVPLEASDPALRQRAPDASADDSDDVITGACERISAPSGRHTHIPRPLKMSINWKGRLLVYHEEAAAVGTLPVHANYIVTSIHCISDPLHFVMAL